MLFWHAGLAFVMVLIVFSSPALDFRLVMAGAVLPNIELLWQPGPLHSIVTPIVVMAVIMVFTQKRRLVRRQLLGIPIGLFVHLVLDGSWANAALFWWPFLGAVEDASTAVEAGRSTAVLIGMELVGIAVLAFAVQRFELIGEGRDRFVRTGQLDRALMD